jgi:hypothetical protein
MGDPKSQWKSIRTSNAIERLTKSTPRSCAANLPRRSARAVVIAEALSEGRIREWFFADAVTRRILLALRVQIDDIALEPSVIGQHLPRQRMVAFAKP